MPRPTFSGGTAPASSQACAGGGPGKRNHHPVPAFTLAALLTACGVPASGQPFALGLFPPPRSPIGQRRPRPRALRCAFHWPSLGGGAGDRRALPLSRFRLRLLLRLREGRWRRPCGPPCFMWAVSADGPVAALLGASSAQAAGRPGCPGYCAGVAAALAPGK